MTIDLDSKNNQEALLYLLSPEDRTAFSWDKYIELVRICNWSYYYGLDDQEYAEYWSTAEPLEHNDLPANFWAGMEALEEMLHLFPCEFYGESFNGEFQWVSGEDPADDDANYACSHWDAETGVCTDPTRLPDCAHGAECNISYEDFFLSDVYEGYEARNILLTKHLRELI